MAINKQSILGRLRLYKSLKARLFIILFLVGLIPCVIMRAGILENYEDRAVSVRRSDVQTQLKIIANHLITYNYLQDTSSEVINAELEQLSSLYNGRVIIINSNLKIVKDTYGISDGKTIISEEIVRCLKGASITKYDKTNGYIEITTPIMETINDKNVADTTGEKAVVKGVMLTSVSTDSVVATKDLLSRNALIIEMIVIFVLFGLAMILVNILIKPFARVTQAISTVKEGYSDEPISVPDYLETERIVDAFNQLQKRMKILDDSRQEFVSNVSHELKTPITSIKVLADSLLTQEDVPNELYREFMVDITNEIEREDKIINDLLALVKMDKTKGELTISTVDINMLAEIILKRLRPIARKKDIELILECKREVVAAVDEVKMSLILTNLTENAIKYNKEQGTVRVVIDADHQYFTIEVSDSGIGIPEEELEHIYERFYRVDKSHSRDIGGTGLGLAITKSAVLMHHGTISATSVMNEGTVFTVKIPLSYISVPS